MPMPQKDHGHGDPGEVRRVGREAAEPGHAEEGPIHPARQQAGAAQAGAIRGTMRTTANITAVTGRKASPALRRCTQHPLKELGDEEEHGVHAAHHQDPGGVGTGTLTAGEEPQR